MWTLAEFSKVETDVLRKSVIDTLLFEVSAMAMIPWETLGALATTVIQYKDLPSVGFRKVNAAFSESTGTFQQKTETLSLSGLDIDTDKTIARAKNTVADARAVQQNLALKAYGYTFNEKFILGDPVSNPEEFKGVQKRIDDIAAAGFDSQLIDVVEADQLPGDTAANDAFLDKLDELIYSIKGHSPDAIYMNSKMLLILRSILRRNRLLDQSKDMFGRNIDMYGNVKLLPIGVKSDQVTEIILSNETKGGGTGETSLYAVKFGIGDMLWGIQQYPLEVVDLGELQEKPVYRTRMDWPLGMADVDPRCMARLYGVKIVA